MSKDLNTAEEMTGYVKRFDAERGFGFVDGADGKSYFLHISEVRGGEIPDAGQQVHFTPTATEKGPAALAASLGQAPSKYYVDLTNFIVSSTDVLPGGDIEIIGGVHCPLIGSFMSAGDAERELVNCAKARGANAIINFRIQRSSQPSRDNPNYLQTVYSASGEPVYAQRVAFSADPDLIEREYARVNAMLAEFARQEERDQTPIVGRVSKGTLAEIWDSALLPSLRLGGKVLGWGWKQLQSRRT
ncbi:cold-shock protein [Pseudomonas nitroreducens]|uniref:cold-shock protein n=1 Tax=Pseudomonas nitroreducens TaxID=46680 RepID=UPI00351CEFE9